MAENIMDDFDKYEKLRHQGVGPKDVYNVATSDGLDLITSIRLLRKLFGMSLVEAKKVSGMLDALNSLQKVIPGSMVYWEDSGPNDNLHILEGRVTQIVDGLVYVDGQKKYCVYESGLVELPSAEKATSISVDRFERTLADRITDFVSSWQERSEIAGVIKAV
jgi:hypothetical protein